MRANVAAVAPQLYFYLRGKGGEPPAELDGTERKGKGVLTRRRLLCRGVMRSNS